jgi:20S proteasome subunit alpha 6
MLPPFLKAPSSSKLTLLVHLDAEKPNVEPKWVKSGDIQEWLKTMFGRMFWVRGDVADGWEKKIEVVDPDPVRDFLINDISLLNFCLGSDYPNCS